jgi:hypothetical protein
MDGRDHAEPACAARRLGAVVQGVALGLLVAVAVLNLALVASDAQVFRYQGF